MAVLIGAAGTGNISYLTYTQVSPSRVVVTSTGVAYAAFADGKVFKSSDNGGSWTSITPTGYISSGSNITAVSISLDNNNNLVLVYTAISGTNLGTTSWATYNGTSWTSFASLQSVEGYAVDTCSTPNGEVHAVWYANFGTASTGVYYAVKAASGGSWSTPAKLTGAANVVNNIAADPSNGVHIISAATAGITSVAYIKKPSGGSWSSVVNVTVSNVSGTMTTQLVVDPTTGNPAFAVFGLGNANIGIRYFAHNGTSWGSEEVVVTASATVRQYGGLYFHSDGVPYVIYTENGSGGATEIKGANKSSGAWVSNITLQAVASTLLNYPTFGVTAYNSRVLYTYRNNTNGNVYSDGITINQPPLAPTLGSRPNFSASASAVFPWTFNDPDSGDTQSAYQLVIEVVSNGSIAYDSGQVASTTPSHALAAATLTNGVSYRWKVRAWDSAGAASPYSSYALFTTTPPPSTAITFPAVNGDVVGSNTLTVRWSFSNPGGGTQGWYQVRLLNQAGSTVHHTSGKVSDQGARLYTVPFTLISGTNYQVEVTTWNIADVPSTAVVRTFSANFVAPALPAVTFTQMTTGSMRVVIDNSNPGGGVPDTSHNEVWRRRTGSGEALIRVANDVAFDGTYHDYAAGIDTAYDYVIRAVSTSGSTVDTAPSSQTLTAAVAEGVFIHNVTNPAGTIVNLKYVETKGEGLNPRPTFSQYAGRSRPTAEYGVQVDHGVNLTATLLQSSAEYLALYRLVESQATVLYRDSRGRRVFGAISTLGIVDGDLFYTATLAVVETAHIEAV